MEELANDPIIAFYMKMSSSTDAETEVPLFSETMLRLSFKEIFGTLRPLCPEELQLYRKLILFNFSENYTSMSDLVAIMTCFDEAAIRDYFDNYAEILDEWRNFLNMNLSVVIYKEALYEILYEYARRYFYLYGHVSDEVLKRRATEVQKFLRCDVKLPKQWMRSFNALLKNRMGQMQYDSNHTFVKEDLNYLKIFGDIKSRINFLVVEAIANKYKSPELMEKDEGAEPRAKRIKSENLKVLDIEVIKPEDRFDSMGSNGNDLAEAEPEASAFDLDIDAGVTIVNAVDEEYSDVDSEAVKLESNEDTEEIYHELELVDIESDNEEGEEGVAADNDIDNDNDDKENEEIDDSSNQIVDHETAIRYLAALQAYAVVNGHFEAIGLLDKVDSIFRKKIDE